MGALLESGMVGKHRVKTPESYSRRYHRKMGQAWIPRRT